jgi:histone deacetylase 1/2
VFLGYSSLHKGYKCLHIPTNRVYISRDVVFDETVFPFSQISSSTPPPLSSTSPPQPDQFVDAAYPTLLLANHGAGLGRGARLELLDDTADSPPSSPHVDHAAAPGDVDRMPHADRGPT